ncbi:MAG: hypothetical protein R3E84_15900 [Pseudomonadales bacterium]
MHEWRLAELARWIVAVPDRLFRVGCVVMSLLVGAATAAPPPAIDFQNVMDMYFDDSSGLIAFDDYTVAFAEGTTFNGLVAVVDSGGRVMGQHAFYPEFQNRDGVFARIRAVGPADVALSEPGVYTIVFVVDGQPATRFPVELKRLSGGDDPFTAGAGLVFDGYWRTLAHITEGRWKDQPIPVLTLWLGGLDLAGGRRDSFFVTLRRAGAVVAHSKRALTTIQPGHFRRTQVQLFHPHEQKQEPNAPYFTMADLARDGDYDVAVTRASDGASLRTFGFTVKDGRVQGLHRSATGYEPRPDYIMPRVLRPGATGLEMIEATWIQRRD